MWCGSVGILAHYYVGSCDNLRFPGEISPTQRMYVSVLVLLLSYANVAAQLRIMSAHINKVERFFVLCVCLLLCCSQRMHCVHMLRNYRIGGKSTGYILFPLLSSSLPVCGNLCRISVDLRYTFKCVRCATHSVRCVCFLKCNWIILNTWFVEFNHR